MNCTFELDSFAKPTSSSRPFKSHSRRFLPFNVCTGNANFQAGETLGGAVVTIIYQSLLCCVLKFTGDILVGTARVTCYGPKISLLE